MGESDKFVMEMKKADYIPYDTIYEQDKPLDNHINEFCEEGNYIILDLQLIRKCLFTNQVRSKE